MGKGMETIRVITGKIGLDGHDRGIKVVTRALRDAGMEVVYLGMRLGIGQIAEAAVDEDVDVLALNFAGADHLVLVPRLMTEIARLGRSTEDLVVVVGGIIPDEDVPLLESMGVREVFLPGTPLAEIAATIEAIVRQDAGAQ